LLDKLDVVINIHSNLKESIKEENPSKEETNLFIFNKVDTFIIQYGKQEYCHISN